MVVKKDGQRQRFDDKKLLAGLLKACEKRPIPVSKLEELVEEVELMLQEKQEKEIPAEEIGLFLPPGTLLRGGTRLESNDGRIVEVVSSRA